MDEKHALNIVNQCFMMIFDNTNSLSLEELLAEFAFDIRLPKKVLDTITGEETWTSCINSMQFITQNNMRKYDQKYGWMIKKREIKNLNELLDIWKKTNYTTTERQYDCINVAQSDPIYSCQNAFRCTDCNHSKNLIFCDGCIRCEFIVASQRTCDSGFCLRVDDSSNCSNSYNVICSNSISNSFFIQDCNNLHECMFCSHISNKKYCIANMPFEKEEYLTIKKEIIKWILSKGNNSKNSK